MLAVAVGFAGGARGQEPRVVTHSERGFIGEITAVLEVGPEPRCELYMLVQRREGEEPFPDWAVKRFDELRVCVRADVPITVWTEADTVRTGSLDELRPGVDVRVSLMQGVFMTDPPTAEAFSLDILEYVRKPDP